jgi:hypothetical protein
MLAANAGGTLSLLTSKGCVNQVRRGCVLFESAGKAMNSVSVLKTGTLNRKTFDLQPHKQDDARLGCQPISLLAVLKTENLRLRQAVAELSLDTSALRQALKESRPATASRISDQGTKI